MLLRRGDGDAMLCGTFGRHKDICAISQRHRLKTGASIFAG